MCGIVGLVAKNNWGFTAANIDMFQDMLIADSVRGHDSTGSFLITKDNGLSAVKHNSFPHHLMMTKGWGKYRETAIQHGQIIIGHNRAATKGAVSNENAHPFHEGNIILVHNGTLFNHKSIADTDVDSHAICKGFADKGHVATLKALSGAWALVWFDLKAKTLYLTRNEDRPLAVLETRDMFLLGSEINMLHWIAARAHLNFAEENIHVLKPFDLYEFKMDDGYRGWKKSNIKHAVEKTHVPFVHQPAAQPPASPPALTKSGGRAVWQRSPYTEFNDRISHALADQHYSNKTMVMVIPLEAEYAYSDGSPRYRLSKAIAYVPGKPPVKCSGILPGNINTVERLHTFMSGGKLTAQCFGYTYLAGNQDVAIQVNNFEEVTLSTSWNDASISWEEFEQICLHQVCSQCKGNMDLDDLNVTEVYAQPQWGQYSCVCARCVESKLSTDATAEVILGE